MIRHYLTCLSSLALATCATAPAAAQSLTLTNLKAALARTCPTIATVRTTTVFWRELAACQAKLAPVPIPTPTPPPVPILPSTFTVPLDKATKPAWGTGAIPGLYDANEGAFRFNCKGDGALASDDPLDFPGKPGAAHLHDVWGNRAFNAFTNAASLAASADTTCNRTPYSANRSQYWQPALVHDSGRVVRPKLVSIYYKRAARTSPQCTPGDPRRIGECVDLPDNLDKIWGWDRFRPNAKVEGAWWGCDSAGPAPDLDTLFAQGCKPGETLITQTLAPHCWDGQLTSPDKRSHVTYGSYGDSGVYRCPATHPKLIPQLENKVLFTITADMIGVRADGSRYSRVKLSSDHMLPGAKPGQTLHADYIEKWDPRVKAIWHANCIEKRLSCNGGDLGNGQQLVGAE